MSFSNKLSLVLLLSSFLIHASFGEPEIICEDLPKEVCTFSIASSGKRCLLETEKGVNGETEYKCRTSEVMVERISEYIETVQCVESCGIGTSSSVGISSDAFFGPQFIGKLCSPSCYQKCPNIVDLFFNLAAGEGVFLPELCEKHRGNPGRAMVELEPVSYLSTAPAFPPDNNCCCLGDAGMWELFISIFAGCLIFVGCIIFGSYVMVLIFDKDKKKSKKVVPMTMELQQQVVVAVAPED